MSTLLDGEIRPLNIGLELFCAPFQREGIGHMGLDWKPPAQGDKEIMDLLFRIRSAPRDSAGLTARARANKEAVERIMGGQPVLTGVRPAHEVFNGMTPNTLYHAGPPVNWEDMCGPMKAAFIGALKYENLAQSDEEAEKLVTAGKIDYSPNHHHGAVGPMTGVISYNMPVFVVENATFGNRAYCTINEGIGEVMRFGANGPSVIARLQWLKDSLAPVLDAAIGKAGGVNLKAIMAQALSMGDEMHQRNVAASLLFYRKIAGPLAEIVAGAANGPEIVMFLAGKNEQFFLNLAMAACKAIMDPARGIDHSSVITAMSRNGTRFGINVSSLGSEWFEAPCNMPKGMYFPGFSAEDANPDMGDSTIVECYGIGGFAMACAPAVVNFVGAGSVTEALNNSMDMQAITVGQNADLPMPPLDFMGTATGIDIVEVVESGILPIINTGIAHRKPGVGQVGAGIVTPPMEIMVEALRAYVQQHGL